MRRYTNYNSGCNGCEDCGGSGSENCLSCTKGGEKCLDSQYSVLGGVVAPRNSAYIMPSMSNPKAERPINKINTSLPSLRDRGSISNMDNFNPYSRQYENKVVQRNIASIPQTYGNQKFYTNVKLEGRPVGSPILSRKGVETYHGYLPPTINVGKKICGDKTCKMKVKSGGIFGGGHSILGIGVSTGKIQVPCQHAANSQSCVCQGTDHSC